MVRLIDVTTSGASDLIVAMTMMPKLVHVDYAAVTASRPSCDLGTFATVAGAYHLLADDSGRRRLALSDRAGDPAAAVIPVTLITDLVTSTPQKPAPVAGYLLAVLTPDTLTGWFLYSGLPDAAMLMHDMATALSGKGQPIFRNGPGNTTHLFMQRH